MTIETKYNIGDRIWIAYEHNGEVHVYEDYITEVVIRGDIELTPMGSTNNRKIEYIGKLCPEGIPEEEIVPYNDSDKLIRTIRRLNDAKK